MTVLLAPDVSKPFELHVDASQVGAGGVLLATDDLGVESSVFFLQEVQWTSDELFCY